MTLWIKLHDGPDSCWRIASAELVRKTCRDNGADRVISYKWFQGSAAGDDAGASGQCWLVLTARYLWGRWRRCSPELSDTGAAG